MSRTDSDASDVKVARWVATIAGLIGFVLSVATPLLPVVQTTATLNWPQAGQLNNVTAPLITQAPVTMTATVPCEVIRTMPPAGGLVLGTAPARRQQAALNALFVNVNAPARGHHRPQRRGGQRAARTRWHRRTASASRSPRRRRARSPRSSG